MRLTVIRKFKGQNYTIGNLYINDKYFCDTLEDIDRGLKDSMTPEEITSIKIKGDTCIPTGTYKVVMNVVSSKFSNYAKYSYAKSIGARMPRVLNVKGFDGVLIHPGNTTKDTEGCLLVGYNKVKGSVSDSLNTWKKLYTILLNSINNKEDIYIEYK